MASEPSSPDFSELELAPEVLRAVQGLGYETPTPVQAQCIPHLLAGHDMVGQAQTGTGKTAAFALPLLSRIELGRREPQVLVLAPTRELALQVAEAFQSYARHLKGFHVLPLYGGQNIETQLRQLRRGAHVIVGTPGRVMDHLRRRTLSLAGLATVVLDEGDEMLRMGFVDDIEWILEQAPEKRQVALFSATMPAPIRKVAGRHLKDPVEIKVASKTATVSAIVQSHCIVNRHQKMDALTRLLEVQEFDAMLIFVRTKTATTEVAEKLQAHGFDVAAMNGDMNQSMRERVISRLKKGEVDIVVATDVAARGLDVKRISYVLNFDIPTEPQAYVHRIGRTGRAGRAGRALSFVQPRERHLLKAIERAIGQRIQPMELPTADNLSEHRIDRFVARLQETISNQKLDFFYRLVARIEEDNELSVTDIAAALTFLSQGERPFVVETLKAPPGKQRREREPAARSQSHPTRDSSSRPPAKRAPEAPARSESRAPREDRKHDDDVPRLNYRIDVGTTHGVTAREIVGAIANEAGLDGQYIGRVVIGDKHSTVELPEGMPHDIYQHLCKVYVCNQQLNLRIQDMPNQGERLPTKAGKRVVPDKPARVKKKKKPAAMRRAKRRKEERKKLGK